MTDSFPDSIQIHSEKARWRVPVVAVKLDGVLISRESLVAYKRGALAGYEVA